MLHGIVKVKVKIEVKQSHYRPGEALMVPGSWHGFIVSKINEKCKERESYVGR
jgi:hypothetical protein